MFAFGASFSGQVLDLISAQLRLKASLADDLLVMGITLLVRVVLRSGTQMCLRYWFSASTHVRILTTHSLASRSSCVWCCRQSRGTAPRLVVMLTYADVR